jgi:periplasmic protein TonB
MDTKDILKMSLDEIVFMGRNKQYGGFLLRQLYGSHIKKGIIGGLILFGLMVAYPAISSYISELTKKDEKLDMTEV